MSLWRLKTRMLWAGGALQPREAIQLGDGTLIPNPDRRGLLTWEGRPQENGNFKLQTIRLGREVATTRVGPTTFAFEKPNRDLKFKDESYTSSNRRGFAWGGERLTGGGTDALLKDVREVCILLP